MAFSLICDGDVSVLPDGAPACSGAWILQQVPTPFSLDQLDPALLSQAVLVGYALILGPWLTTRGIRALLELLRTKNHF